MARPKLDIDTELVEKLAAIHCTVEEIASVVGCSVDTLDRRYAECIKKGKDQGRAALRRKQWQAAENGNVTMMIWLGKQLLGQTDKIDNSHMYPTPIVVERTNGTQVIITAKKRSELPDGTSGRDTD